MLKNMGFVANVMGEEVVDVYMVDKDKTTAFARDLVAVAGEEKPELSILDLVVNESDTRENPSAAFNRAIEGMSGEQLSFKDSASNAFSMNGINRGMVVSRQDLIDCDLNTAVLKLMSLSPKLTIRSSIAKLTWRLEEYKMLQAAAESSRSNPRALEQLQKKMKQKLAELTAERTMLIEVGMELFDSILVKSNAKLVKENIPAGAEGHPILEHLTQRQGGVLSKEEFKEEQLEAQLDDINELVEGEDGLQGTIGVLPTDEASIASLRDGTGRIRQFAAVPWKSTGLSMAPFSSLFSRADYLDGTSTRVPSFLQTVCDELSYIYRRLVKGFDEYTLPNGVIVAAVPAELDTFCSRMQPQEKQACIQLVKDFLNKELENAQATIESLAKASLKQLLEGGSTAALDERLAKAVSSYSLVIEEGAKLDELLQLDGEKDALIITRLNKLFHQMTVLYGGGTKAPASFEAKKQGAVNLLHMKGQLSDFVFLIYNKLAAECSLLKYEPFVRGLQERMKKGSIFATLEEMRRFRPEEDNALPIPDTTLFTPLFMLGEGRTIPTVCTHSSKDCKHSCLIASGQNTLQGKSIVGRPYTPPSFFKATEHGAKAVVGVNETQLVRSIIPTQTYNYTVKMYITLMLYTYPIEFCRVLVHVLISYASYKAAQKQRLVEYGIIKHQALKDEGINGLPAFYRLNIFSDIPWELFCPSLFEIFSGSAPQCYLWSEAKLKSMGFKSREEAEASFKKAGSVFNAIYFYDYTKVPNRGPFRYNDRGQLLKTNGRVATETELSKMNWVDARQSLRLLQNYNLTFSYSGHNLKDCLNELAFNKRNITVSFFKPSLSMIDDVDRFLGGLSGLSTELKGALHSYLERLGAASPFPKQFLGFDVIDGDLYDNRTFDRFFQVGDEPVVVGLSWKSVKIGASYAEATPFREKAAAGFSYVRGADLQRPGREDNFLVNLELGAEKLTTIPLLNRLTEADGTSTASRLQTLVESSVVDILLAAGLLEGNAKAYRIVEATESETARVIPFLKMFAYDTLIQDGLTKAGKTKRNSYLEMFEDMMKPIGIVTETGASVNVLTIPQVVKDRS